MLVDGKTTVWDSLAILEYLAEKEPQALAGRPGRTGEARAISAEMHSGFPNLRNHMSMNVRKRYPGGARRRSWRRSTGSRPCGTRRRRPFLFGPFTAVDAMYAPIVLRFRTYEVELPRGARYYDAMLELPAMREWIAAAERETESIPQFDMYE